MTIDKIIGIILSITSLLLIICILFKKKEPFFNFREIVKNHLHLFSNCKSQYFIFYVLPVFLSVGISLLFSANAAFFFTSWRCFKYNFINAISIIGNAEWI